MSAPKNPSPPEITEVQLPPQKAPKGKKTYLGDGVYASFDGFDIWLTTERENGEHRICLSTSELSALHDFAATVYDVRVR